MRIFERFSREEMKYFLYGLFFCVWCLGVAGCRGRAMTGVRTDVVSDSVAAVCLPVGIAPRHARGFTVTAGEGCTLVEIRDPAVEEGAPMSRLALIPRGTSPAVPAGYDRVEVPVERVVCMTSLQLSGFLRLGLLDKVAGIASSRHLHHAGIRRRIADGRTRRIGIEGNFDSEIILSIVPDLIFISPYKRGGYDALRDVDIPLVPHLGYKELTPLGQAEWIKFIALFTGDAELAVREFDSIETHYDALCELTRQVERRPVVFSGELRGGNWYAVGGRSFLAQLFRDAGADYFLGEDPRSGGVVLDFEQVYSRAAEADYWRILNSYDGPFSYETLRRTDARYADFKAWSDRGVIYCNLREKPFYENTPTEPDVVLADLIRIFHPDLLPDHRGVYYELLD